MEERCVVTELIKSQCAHCRRQALPKGVDKTKVAAYDSRCPCGGKITEGQTIALIEGEWHCPDCRRDAS